MSSISDAVKVVPSERQYAWQKLEFYAFFHFGLNTFTGKEWGSGHDDQLIFNPAGFSADQWVSAVKSAGMKGAILTCKHHDGFCLWPSQYTGYTIKNTPFLNGNGDIVKSLSESCKAQGIKFGVYLSPWDRHEPSYGSGKEYNEYFMNQLRELLTNYGDIFCVWFDGACGEGANGKKQSYDWDGYFSVIRELQPEAAISICGPDVRWCGNEAGHCRESEWSVVPEFLADEEKIADKSQKKDDTEFRERKVNSRVEDLGSRDIISKADKLIWYPCEVNTSIRPNWFYNENDNDKVRSLEELLNIYYQSVGGNASFLLNVPPDKRGLVYEEDVKRLKELGLYLEAFYSNNLAPSAKITADTWAEGYGPSNILNEDEDQYWKSEKETAEILLEFPDEQTVGHVILMENIRDSQRVESFSLYAEVNGTSVEIYKGSVIGHKKICILDEVRTKKLTIKIHQSRIHSTLNFVGVYS